MESSNPSQGFWLFCLSGVCFLLFFFLSFHLWGLPFLPISVLTK